MLDVTPGEGISSATVEFLRAFRPCASCQEWVRLGAGDDGGYETCVDDLRNGSIVAAFSMGVREEDAWSVDVNKRWGVPVYQFDCTVQSAQQCPDCHFYPKCIKSEDGTDDSFPGKSWTLKDVLEQTRLTDAPDRSILMKMDIESSEWPVFEKEDLSLLRKFRQISVEFHVLRVPQEHERKLRSMLKLQQAGFMISHIHGNNWAPFVKMGPYQFPDVVEANLVSDPRQREAHCITDPGDLPGDAPNNPIGPLFGHAKLPSL